MHFTHKNHGTCSTQVDFDLEDGVLHNVVFTRGCNGNTQGVAALAEAAREAGLKF